MKFWAHPLRTLKSNLIWNWNLHIQVNNQLEPKHILINIIKTFLWIPLMKTSLSHDAVENSGIAIDKTREQGNVLHVIRREEMANTKIWSSRGMWCSLVDFVRVSSGCWDILLIDKGNCPHVTLSTPWTRIICARTEPYRPDVENYTGRRQSKWPIR